MSSAVSWGVLIVAGLMEVAWSSCLKLSAGFTVPLYSILAIVGMVASFVLLAFAAKKLPLAIAYPVWTGIGAIGSVLVGAFVFREKLGMASWIFVVLLVVAIIGLKVSAGK
jgi:quaternary ammonium compound-resistance protein SugE